MKIWSDEKVLFKLGFETQLLVKLPSLKASAHAGDRGSACSTDRVVRGGERPSFCVLVIPGRWEL